MPGQPSQLRSISDMPISWEIELGTHATYGFILIHPNNHSRTASWRVPFNMNNALVATALPSGWETAFLFTTLCPVSTTPPFSSTKLPFIVNVRNNKMRYLTDITNYAFLLIFAPCRATGGSNSLASWNLIQTPLGGYIIGNAAAS